ncbi:MAG: biliverdin-producing heme oxygenase [Saprospirales bacterium]|nr:biliverdin-producing heme oxygenase [Saprospirales bacterium]
MLPLKEATSEKHKIAERMPFNVKMFRGQLSKEEYGLYLVQQRELFRTIEAKGTPHSSLNRVSAIDKDLAELPLSDHALLPSTRHYAEYLNKLDYDGTLPHIYLHYLAIMFGGQIMKKSVPSTGHMYDFDNMQEAMLSIRALQRDDWAEEVNKGFDFAISIFQELDEAISNGQTSDSADIKTQDHGVA